MIFLFRRSSMLRVRPPPPSSSLSPQIKLLSSNWVAALGFYAFLS